MYIISPDFCQDLISKNFFLKKYFAPYILQDLLEDCLKYINKSLPEAENIFINNLAELNDLLQNQFIRKQGIERSDLTGENISERQSDLLQKLIRAAAFNKSAESVIPNPIILGSTYKSMYNLFKVALNKNFTGKINILVSDRPFIHNECNPEKIAEIIAAKNALDKASTLNIKMLIEKNFSSMEKAKGEEMEFKRVIMYLQIIDSIKNTSYSKDITILLAKTSGNLRKFPTELLKVKEIIYANTQCLATESDLAELLAQEQGLKKSQYNIVSAKTDVSKQDRATTADTYKAFIDSSFYNEDEQYTIVAKAEFCLRQCIEFEKYTNKTPHFITDISKIDITLSVFLDDMARTIYTVYNLTQEKKTFYAAENKAIAPEVNILNLNEEKSKDALLNYDAAKSGLKEENSASLPYKTHSQESFYKS